MRRSKMEPENESKKAIHDESFSEMNKNKQNVLKQIHEYIDEQGIHPNMETLSQITGYSVAELKSMIDQTDLFSYKSKKLGLSSDPIQYNIIHLRAKGYHKTYYLYDEERSKYLPMRILDVIYDDTDQKQYSTQRWISKMVILVKYPESGWSVLVIPDNEIYKYFYGRVVVNFVDLPEEAFETLEDALEVIKEWKAYSVEITDLPNVWSGFSYYIYGKSTDITEEVSSIIPEQFVKQDIQTKSINDKKESSNDKKWMDEVVFAQMQQEKCGFTGLGITHKDYLYINKKTKQIGIEKLSTSEKIKLAFIMTFGIHGSRIDLDKALLIVENIYNKTRLINPFDVVNDEYSFPISYYTKDDSVSNHVYKSWLENIGHISVILGTIYAYKNEVVKSCYYFLQALKTENLFISESYYDFMNYMFSRLSDLPKTSYLENPIENRLYSDPHSVKLGLQNRIISDLVNDNEDMIVAHYMNGHIYGYIKHTEDDVCETWIITSKFELKRFNFELRDKFTIPVTDMRYNFERLEIELPGNFRIKRNSNLLTIRSIIFRPDSFDHMLDYRRYDIDDEIYSRISNEIICRNNLHPIF